ncbi:MAG: EAL domain-containing protein [Thermoanaerobaculia bacterium]|nr:EAL domain-containing protein [Thermoanaerobaculia bacterium]
MVGDLANLPEEVLEALDDAAVVTDAEGTILWTSARVEALWGYTGAELQRKKLQLLISFEVAELQPESGAAERREPGRLRPVEAYRKDGTTFPVGVVQVTTLGGRDRRILVLVRDLSELRQSRDRLRQLEKALETAQVGVAITDRDLAVRWANPALADMHGAGSESLLGRPLAHFLPAELQDLDFRNLAGMRRLRREGESARADGSLFPVEVLFDLVFDDQNEPVGVVAVCQNISERREAEEALRESEERYTLAVRGANDGIWDWDLGSDRVYYSNRWKSMLGLEDEELAPTPDAWFSRVHPEDLPGLRTRLDRHLAGTTEMFEDEHRLEHHDGNYRWMLARGVALLGKDGRPSRLAGSQTDITDRKVHDPLTGLPNRALFLDRLERARARARRGGRNLFGVLFLDLDRFKVVNDSLGHPIGDQLLVAVAGRIESCIRPGDTVARLGGDEFAVLLEEMGEFDESTEVASRIHAAFTQPFVVSDHELFVTVSIGISLGSSESDDLGGVLRDADTAMYRAKIAGRGRSQVFTGEMRTEVIAQLQLENDLRRAIERQEFEVYYQPILALRSSAITGFEALVRWHHPERGLVEPARFIGAAEETGIIVPLGMWVLEEACRQLRIWREADAAWSELTMSVNLSPKLFAQLHLVRDIVALLELTGLPSRLLKLELTEGILVHNPQAANAMLKELRALGIGVCIDDFGTGYSSLSYLTSLNVDVLKIDRSFIHNMTSGASGTDGSEVVRNIVRLAAGLGLSVVAEGVETPDQRDQLEAMDCEFVQGFHFSRPVDAETVWRTLLNHG